MARLTLLFIATLALVLTTSAAPCHDKDQGLTGQPDKGLEYLDNDIGNFESDDDLGFSDIDSDELPGDLDPSELDGGNGIDEGYPEEDEFGPGDGNDGLGPDDGSDGFGPDEDFGGDDGFGPDDFGGDDGFGPDDFGNDGLDPDCPEGTDEPIGEGGFDGPDRGRGKGSLINIEADYIGTGPINADGVGSDNLSLDNLNIDNVLENLNVA